MAEQRKSVFITGAASGMGRETALLFARKGWFVGAYDVNQEGLESLKCEIGDVNGIFASLDVADPDAFATAMTSFGDATGGTLDLMFNNVASPPADYWMSSRGLKLSGLSTSI